jgi:predicted nucleic acid-binding protein
MYLVGVEHPNKTIARVLVERLVAERDRLVTDAEVLQEILHRYTAIQRRDAIQPAFDVLLGIVDEVVPIELTDVQRAKTLLHGKASLSARDAIHVAIMERRGIARILSFDAGFDGQPGVERMHG